MRAVDAGVVLLVGAIPDGEGLAPRLELLHLLGPRKAHPPKGLKGLSYETEMSTK
jgi:hypothetical protein